MHIQHFDDGKNGEFFILADNQQKIAKLNYTYIDATTINAHHTFVDSQLRGQGIADKLYSALMQFVNTQELTLRAGCEYIARKQQRDNNK